MVRLFEYLVMAGITFPVSFLVARAVLRGVVRVVNGPVNRDVLSSQP